MRGQNLREVKIADLHKAKKRLAKHLTPTPLTSSELLKHISGRKSVS